MALRIGIRFIARNVNAKSRGEKNHVATPAIPKSSGLMTKNKDYFKSTAIGSSLLGDCIVSEKPLSICTDRAIKEKKPTSFMEMGRIFEDLVQSEYDPEFDFWEKYFKSDLNEIPNTTAKGIKNILVMFEDDHLTEDEQGHVYRTLHRDIKDGYVYNKPKKDGSRELNSKYLNRHRCLDQIKAHDYRRPIPAPWWERLEAMLRNFKNYDLTLTLGGKDYGATIDYWMTQWADVLFQVEYFWYDEEAEADCRAKFDMIWLIEIGGVTYAVPLDLKCTGDGVESNSSFGAFVRNWREKYAWQGTHYRAGLKRWCSENGCIPYSRMPYIIQESDEPQVTNVWELHEQELADLDAPYKEALRVIQEWINDGKPIKGQMPQKVVNRYGKEWNI